MFSFQQYFPFVDYLYNLLAYLSWRALGIQNSNSIPGVDETFKMARAALTFLRRTKHNEISVLVAFALMSEMIWTYVVERYFPVELLIMDSQQMKSIEEVYKKWESRTAGGPSTNEQNVSNPGKKAWEDRFGDRIPATKREPARYRTKKRKQNKVNTWIINLWWGHFSDSFLYVTLYFGRKCVLTVKPARTDVWFVRSKIQLFVLTLTSLTLFFSSGWTFVFVYLMFVSYFTASGF